MAQVVPTKLSSPHLTPGLWGWVKRKPKFQDDFRVYPRSIVGLSAPPRYVCITPDLVGVLENCLNCNSSIATSIAATLRYLHCNPQHRHCVGCKRVCLVPHRLALRYGLTGAYKTWAVLTLQTGFLGLSRVQPKFQEQLVLLRRLEKITWQMWSQTMEVIISWLVRIILDVISQL